jgi:hypothetical protein
VSILDVTNHAVTIWMMAWKSAEDAFVNGLHPYAMYRVGGNVCDGNELAVSGNVMEGQADDDYYFTGQEYSMPFDDAENDFVVFIARSHGEANPDMMPSQIHTYWGGCEEDLDDGGPLSPCWEYLLSFHE